MSQSGQSKIVVWCLLDDRPGHQNQSLGLAEAIARVAPAEVIQLPSRGWMRGLRTMLGGQPFPRAGRGNPDLVIAAGHSTHLPLIAAGRRYGGKSVVLMRPSLPSRCFDLCLMPEVHRVDQPPKNVLYTRGVLNRIVPSNTKDAGKGLIMIGGPSQHFEWSDQRVVDQVAQILVHSPGMQWTIGTSRRTPDTLVAHWKRNAVRANLVTPERAPAGWLIDQYATAATVWVTEDSVSMTYEAVTSGASVGLIELKAIATNRVTRSIDASGRIWTGLPI